MASDHVRGEMDISQHKSTFDGFMAVTVWSSLITGLWILYFTLVFAVGFDWMGSLIACTVLGVIGGLALNMRTSWYMAVVGQFIFGLVCGGIVMLFGAALGG